MKKLMVLQVRQDAPDASVALKRAKKQAKLIKKLHDKLWGKDSCEVVVLESTAVLFSVCEDYEPAGSLCTPCAPQVLQG